MIRVKLANPPIIKRIKEKMEPKVRENWKSYNKDRTGGRQMFARPFEDYM